MLAEQKKTLQTDRARKSSCLGQDQRRHRRTRRRRQNGLCGHAGVACQVLPDSRLPGHTHPTWLPWWRMQINVADAKDKLPELIRAVEGGESCNHLPPRRAGGGLVRTRTSTRRKPKLGTLRGKIAIQDPDWWKAMSEEETEAFVDGRT